MRSGIDTPALGLTQGTVDDVAKHHDEPGGPPICIIPLIRAKLVGEKEDGGGAPRS